MKLNFTRIDGLNNIGLPKRATKFSAAYDLFVPKFTLLNPGEQVLIKLGITWKPDLWHAKAEAIGIRDNVTVVIGGFFAKIFDKSGHAVKFRFNTRAGVIDADYPDEWGVVGVNEWNDPISFKEGRAIAQFVLLPFLVADDLEDSEPLAERVGGFGSTGK